MQLLLNILVVSDEQMLSCELIKFLVLTPPVVFCEQGGTEKNKGPSPED